MFKNTILALDTRTARKIVERLWASGHQAECDGTAVRSDAPDNVMQDAIAACAYGANDESVEANDLATAQRRSIANPRWWGCKRANVEAFGGYVDGKLLWRCENGYLCHVLLLTPPVGSAGRVVWNIKLAADAVPDDFLVNELAGTVSGDPDVLAEVAKSACVWAARGLMKPLKRDPSVKRDPKLLELLDAARELVEVSDSVPRFHVHHVHALDALEAAARAWMVDECSICGRRGDHEWDELTITERAAHMAEADAQGM